MGISRRRLALTVHIPATRINAIAQGKRLSAADTASRLGKFFGVDPRFWWNLQSSYDFDVAQRALESELAPIIAYHGSGDVDLS